jgi:hypothetical protein
MADVKFVPAFHKNLLSFVRLERKGIRIAYDGGKRYLLDQGQNKLAEVRESRNILVILFKAISLLANAKMICNVFASRTLKFPKAGVPCPYDGRSPSKRMAAYKARLVVLGCLQTTADYDAIFSPVIRLECLQSSFTLACHMG